MLVLKRISTLKNVDGTIIDESILEKLKYMGGEPAQTTVAK
jgi:dynein light chain 1